MRAYHLIFLMDRSLSTAHGLRGARFYALSGVNGLFPQIFALYRLRINPLLLGISSISEPGAHTRIFAGVLLNSDMVRTRAWS